jgi:hypothetical protein
MNLFKILFLFIFICGCSSTIDKKFIIEDNKCLIYQLTYKNFNKKFNYICNNKQIKEIDNEKIIEIILIDVVKPDEVEYYLNYLKRFEHENF